MFTSVFIEHFFSMKNRLMLAYTQQSFAIVDCTKNILFLWYEVYVKTCKIEKGIKGTTHTDIISCQAYHSQEITQYR